MAGPFKLDNQYANYAGHWAANTAYAQGKRVIAESTNTGDARKYVFECTTAGTSANPGPPTWNVTPGNTTSDGTVTWTCREATTWANAHGKIKWITLVPAAGEVLHIDDGHAETPSTETWIFNGTVGNPVKIICVDKATDSAVSSYPASALIDFGAAGDLTMYGCVYFWGMYLKIGDDITFGSNTVDSDITFEKSKIYLAFIGSRFIVTNYDLVLNLISTNVEFANVAGYIDLSPHSAGFNWIGGTLNDTLSTNQTKVFNVSGSEGRGIAIIVKGVDLSCITGGDLIKITGKVAGLIELHGVKLNSTPPTFITTNAGIHPLSKFSMDIADSGNTVYKFRRECQYGYAQDETTKVITGKALYDGTNEFTAKMVSRATPTPTFYDPWRYHLTTLRETGFAASRTYTVHIAQDHASVQPDALDDDEIWLEVVYPDDTTAQYNIKTDKIATPTTTPAAQTTSTETWEGLLSTTRLQKLEVQIDAADGKNGPVEIWVCLAKESKTVYVCPKVYVS